MWLQEDFEPIVSYIDFFFLHNHPSPQCRRHHLIEAEKSPFDWLYTAQWGQIPCESAFQCSIYTTKLFILLKTKILNLFLDHRHYKITIRIQKGFGPIGHMWYSVEKRTIYSMHTHGYIIVHTGLSIAKWTNNMHFRKIVSLFVANE